MRFAQYIRRGPVLPYRVDLVSEIEKPTMGIATPIATRPRKSVGMARDVERPTLNTIGGLNAATPFTGFSAQRY